MQTTTVPDADAGPLGSDRQLDANRLVRDDLKQVDVDNAVGDRVELDVLDDTVVGGPADFELEAVRLRREDQLVQLDLVHVEMNLLGSAVQHSGNLSLGAQFGCILFPYALARRAAQ